MINNRKIVNDLVNIRNTILGKINLANNDQRNLLNKLDIINKKIARLKNEIAKLNMEIHQKNKDLTELETIHAKQLEEINDKKINLINKEQQYKFVYGIKIPLTEELYNQKLAKEHEINMLSNHLGIIETYHQQREQLIARRSQEYNDKHDEARKKEHELVSCEGEKEKLIADHEELLKDIADNYANIQIVDLHISASRQGLFATIANSNQYEQVVEDDEARVHTIPRQQ